MALMADITADARWFRGEDKRLEFVIYATADKATVVDVASFGLSWRLASRPGAAAVVAKATGGGGITVAGVFNADPQLNTQVITVAVDDTDTDGLTEKSYWHELKRTDAGLEAVLVHGRAVVLPPIHTT